MRPPATGHALRVRFVYAGARAEKKKMLILERAYAGGTVLGDES